MEDIQNALRLAVIAGAAHALEYQRKNPRATEDRIIQHITENAEDIIQNIDDPL